MFECARKLPIRMSGSPPILSPEPPRGSTPRPSQFESPSTNAGHPSEEFTSPKGFPEGRDPCRARPKPFICNSCRYSHGGMAGVGSARPSIPPPLPRS
jgi:hypothetical protein